MPSTALPLGETSRLNLAKQTSLLTPTNGSGFKTLQYYSAPFQKGRPLQDDRILGGGFNNDVDSRPAGPGLVDVSGKIVAPLDYEQIGFWLNAILGDEGSPTGTGPYTHPFASGGATVPLWTMETTHIAGSAYDVVVGAYAKAAEFSWKAGDQGFGQVSLDFGAGDFLEAQGSSIAGTPAAVSLGGRAPNWLGTFFIGGSQVGAAMDAKLSITNVFEEDRYGGDPRLGGVGLKDRQATIEATVRYTSDAIRANGLVSAIDGRPDPTTASLKWIMSSGLSLVLTAAAVRWEPIGAPIDGPGGLEQKLKGRLEQTSGAAMLAATLVNGRASY